MNQVLDCDKQKAGTSVWKQRVSYSGLIVDVRQR
jgi:hypothetical protein